MAHFQGNRIFQCSGDYASYKLRQEKNLLAKYYDPSFVSCKIQGSWGKQILLCNMHFQVVGEKYHAKIAYNGFNPPKCWIVTPLIKDPQHIYKKGEALCLYDPKKNEWTHKSNLYNTFIPWCIEWVIFQMLYEETGEWQHPERHPSPFSNQEIKDLSEKFNLSIEKIQSIIDSNDF